MRRKLLLVCMALVLVLMPVVVGCDNGVAQKDYDAAVAGKAAAEAELTTAQAQVSSLSGDLAAARASLAKAQEPGLADPIKTNAGYVAGTVIGEPGKEVHIYRGIPYAAPPVGELRWKPPQPVSPWSGVRECTDFSVQSVQYTRGVDTPRSEDCLYLNLLTPATTPTDKLPVMVWFHGGGYATGNANLSLYNNPALPQHGVVLVTVNHRLGGMGLMAHPLLSKESPNGVSGNYQFLDLIASLKWVQENIAAFGGDPNNVTIFGESGGANKTINMMASPLAKGLFHRAIVESGQSITTPMKDAEAMGEALFAKLGVDKEKDPLSAARALSWEKILEVEGASDQDWPLTMDGWFMPDTPANVFKAGKQNVVPFIIGVNLGELTGPGMVVVPFLAPYAVDLFSAANKINGKAYAYVFNQVPGRWKQDGMVAFHGLELMYVFGCLSDSTTWTGMFAGMAQAAGAKQPDPGITDKDREVSEAMMTVWAKFAKTGDPSVESMVTWPAYQAATDKYLYIDGTLQVKSGFSGVAPSAADYESTSTVSETGEIHTGLDIDSTVGELMGNPDTRVVLEKYLPEAVKAPQWVQAYAMTLKTIAPMAPTLLTDEVMQSITDDLEAIK